VKAARENRRARALIAADGYYRMAEARRPQAASAAVLSRPARRGAVCVRRPVDHRDRKTPTSRSRSARSSPRRPTVDVRFVHDRMPVILNGPEAEAAWLDPRVSTRSATRTPT
jgi:putative SOS response-associated peptidase YedK